VTSAVKTFTNVCNAAPAPPPEALSFNQIPVIYFTQLMGLAMGLSADDCRFDLNPPEVQKWLAEKGLIEAVSV